MALSWGVNCFWGSTAKVLYTYLPLYGLRDECMPDKIELEYLLGKLYKEELISIAEKYNLDSTGGKKELIQRLIPEIKPDEELLSKYFGIEQLRGILEKQGLPKSGNKDELVQRLLTAINKSKAKIPKAETKKEKKEKTIVRSMPSLAEEIASYLRNFTLGSISIRDERDLERYLFGVLEKFFEEKSVKIISQYIGVESGSNPDILIEKDGETVVVELKYIKGKGDYRCGIGQAQEYTTIKSGTKVVLFCYDPQKKIKQEIPHLPEVFSIIK
jgi:hypothetical protein